MCQMMLKNVGLRQYGGVFVHLHDHLRLEIKPTLLNVTTILPCHLYRPIELSKFHLNALIELNTTVKIHVYS